MSKIEKIIIAIDEFLLKNNQEFTTPVEINSYLEKKGLLNDSSTRPGLPLRKLLREGKIKHAYQVGVNWRIPASQIKKSKSDLEVVKKTELNKNQNSEKKHKLGSIGVIIVELLEKEFGVKPELLFEHKPNWLLSYPTLPLIEKYSDLSKLYSELVNNQFDLKEKLKEVDKKKLSQKQSFDIWIGSPFNFAVEFDEKQHFNQFRYMTFNYYSEFKTNFQTEFYAELSKDVVIKPTTSGFTKLKSIDPLFPNFLVGEKQDNRIRQRAFRDYLKDLLPIENNCNPTVRIPYHIANKKISNFSVAELSQIKQYIMNCICLDKQNT